MYKTPRLFYGYLLNLQNADFEYILEIFRTFTTYSDNQVKVQKLDQPTADCTQTQKDWS